MSKDDADLTRREIRVLALSAEGKTSEEIARILGLAKRTVDEHATTAEHKLHAASRAHAVALAIKAGLISRNSQ
jgi:DNA-binding CsgD family transcriptional regulator